MLRLFLHQKSPGEYLGMSGNRCSILNSEVIIMYNNGFCGGNICWIIILILLLCNCGGNMFGGNGCGNNCGCDNNCGCC